MDRELLPLVRARGLGLLAWSPLAGGILAGKRHAPAAGGDSPSGEGRDERTETILATLREIAGALGCEPGSVAVAWLSAKGFIPVLGPRDRDQLKANLAAAAVRQTEDQARRLDEVSDRPLGYPYDVLRHTWARLGITDPRSGAVW